jgi:hypothetical protein
MTRVLIVEDEQYFADPLVSVLRERLSRRLHGERRTKI